ncbi:unnamed protein product [Symbiodinium sp. CCMP2456]|nr:unnamed protein product [Symbiodinium sp. CCMP2456]
MALESEASIRARCLSCGSPENIVQEMHGGGITTFAGLAFCTLHQANAGIDDAALMNHVNGDPVIGGQSQEDLKSKLESPAEHETKILPLPQEKMARLTRQKERVVGVVLTLHNTSSHSLIDKACSQLEEGSLRWIHPSRCTSRDSEALSEKPKTSLSLDSTGSFKVSSTSIDKACDASSAHLLRSFFDLIMNLLQPIDRGGQALWLLVAEDTRAKLIEMDPDNVTLRLCESHVNYYADHPDVLFHFMPLKSGGS